MTEYKPFTMIQKSREIWRPISEIDPKLGLLGPLFPLGLFWWVFFGRRDVENYWVKGNFPSHRERSAKRIQRWWKRVKVDHPDNPVEIKRRAFLYNFVDTFNIVGGTLDNARSRLKTAGIKYGLGSVDGHKWSDFDEKYFCLLHLDSKGTLPAKFPEEPRDFWPYIIESGDVLYVSSYEIS